MSRARTSSCGYGTSTCWYVSFVIVMVVLLAGQGEAQLDAASVSHVCHAYRNEANCTASCVSGGCTWCSEVSGCFPGSECGCDTILDEPGCSAEAPRCGWCETRCLTRSTERCLCDSGSVATTCFVNHTITFPLVYDYGVSVVSAYHLRVEGTGNLVFGPAARVEVPTEPALPVTFEAEMAGDVVVNGAVFSLPWKEHKLVLTSTSGDVVVRFQGNVSTSTETDRTLIRSAWVELSAPTGDVAVDGAIIVSRVESLDYNGPGPFTPAHSSKTAGVPAQHASAGCSPLTAVVGDALNPMTTGSRGQRYSTNRYAGHPGGVILLDAGFGVFLNRTASLYTNALDSHAYTGGSSGGSVQVRAHAGGLFGDGLIDVRGGAGGAIGGAGRLLFDLGHGMSPNITLMTWRATAGKDCKISGPASIFWVQAQRLEFRESHAFVTGKATIGLDPKWFSAVDALEISGKTQGIVSANAIPVSAGVRITDQGSLKCVTEGRGCRFLFGATSSLELEHASLWGMPALVLDSEVPLHLFKSSVFAKNIRFSGESIGAPFNNLYFWGGSHAGPSQFGAPVYGNPFWPTDLGSGPGFSKAYTLRDWHGGGYVEVRAPMLLLNESQVHANGDDGYCWNVPYSSRGNGGGSGGSVQVHAPEIVAELGHISAHGGASTGNWKCIANVQPGGAGRILVNTTEATAVSPETLTVSAGGAGSSGTVYWMNEGRLEVTGTGSAANPMPLDDPGALLVERAKVPQLAALGATIPAFQTLEIAAGALASFKGREWRAPVGVRVHVLDGGILECDKSHDEGGCVMFLDGDAEVSVMRGGALRGSPSLTVRGPAARLVVNGTVYSRIRDPTVSQRGTMAKGSGNFVMPGSHAGFNDHHATSPGYGSAIRPHELGSNAQRFHLRFDHRRPLGGGYLHIVVRELVFGNSGDPAHQPAVHVDGEAAVSFGFPYKQTAWWGGASGGSLILDAERVVTVGDSHGVVAARGGDHYTVNAAAGGGGRVHLNVSTPIDMSRVLVTATSTNSGDGTIFDEPTGHLVIDHRNLASKHSIWAGTAVPNLEQVARLAEEAYAWQRGSALGDPSLFGMPPVGIRKISVVNGAAMAMADSAWTVPPSVALHIDGTSSLRGFHPMPEGTVFTIESGAPLTVDPGADVYAVPKLLVLAETLVVNSSRWHAFSDCRVYVGKGHTSEVYVGGTYGGQGSPEVSVYGSFSDPMDLGSCGYAKTSPGGLMDVQATTILFAGTEGSIHSDGLEERTHNTVCLGSGSGGTLRVTADTVAMDGPGDHADFSASGGTCVRQSALAGSAGGGGRVRFDVGSYDASAVTVRADGGYTNNNPATGRYSAAGTVYYARNKTAVIGFSRSSVTLETIPLFTELDTASSDTSELAVVRVLPNAQTVLPTRDWVIQRGLSIVIESGAAVICYEPIPTGCTVTIEDGGDLTIHEGGRLTGYPMLTVTSKADLDLGDGTLSAVGDPVAVAHSEGYHGGPCAAPGTHTGFNSPVRPFAQGTTWNTGVPGGLLIVDVPFSTLTLGAHAHIHADASGDASGGSVQVRAARIKTSQDGAQITANGGPDGGSAGRVAVNVTVWDMEAPLPIDIAEAVHPITNQSVTVRASGGPGCAPGSVYFAHNKTVVLMGHEGPAHTMERFKRHVQNDALSRSEEAIRALMLKEVHNLVTVGKRIEFSEYDRQWFLNLHVIDATLACVSSSAIDDPVTLLRDVVVRGRGDITGCPGLVNHGMVIAEDGPLTLAGTFEQTREYANVTLVALEASSLPSLEISGDATITAGRLIYDNQITLAATETRTDVITYASLASPVGGPVEFEGCAVVTGVGAGATDVTLPAGAPLQYDATVSVGGVDQACCGRHPLAPNCVSLQFIMYDIATPDDGTAAVVTLEPGVYVGPGNTGLVAPPGKNVRLVARDGLGTVTLSCGGDPDVHIVDTSSGMLVLDSVVIEDCPGGAVRVRDAAHVTLRNSRIVGAPVAPADRPLQGGLVYASGALAVLEIEDTEIINGTATVGGCLYVGEESSVVVTRTRFRGCEAGSDGGAAYVTSRGTDAVLEDVVFEENRAGGNAGGLLVGNGAKLEIRGTGNRFTDNAAASCGGISANSDVVVTMGALARLAVLRNTAQLNGGGVCVGMATVVFDPLAFLTVEDNVANGNGGGLFAIASELTLPPSMWHRNSGDLGGGIYAEDCLLRTPVAPLGAPGSANVTFEANTARRGGAMLLSRTTLALRAYLVAVDNVASDTGGAIVLVNAVMEVEADAPDAQLFLVSNQASKSGGAVYVAASEVAIARTTVIGCDAPDAALVALSSRVTLHRLHASGNVGGLLDVLTSTVTVRDARVADTTARAGTRPPVIKAVSSVLEMAHASLVDNVGGSAGMISVTGAGSQAYLSNVTVQRCGGLASMILVQDAVAPVLEDVTLVDNRDATGIRLRGCTNGTLLRVRVSGHERGGAIDVEQGQGLLLLDHVEVARTVRRDALHGAGLAIRDPLTGLGVRVVDSRFDLNVAQRASGGALALWSPVTLAADAEPRGLVLELVRTVFDSNQVVREGFTGHGGAVWVDLPRSATGDAAETRAVGSAVDDLLFTVDACTFNGNRAALSGGAVFVSALGTIAIGDDTRFTNNAAEEGGGGAVFWAVSEPTVGGDSLASHVGGSLVFSGNSAAYGSVVASSPTGLSIVNHDLVFGSDAAVESGDAFAVAPMLALRDAYSQTVRGDMVLAELKLASLEDMVVSAVGTSSLVGSAIVRMDNTTFMANFSSLGVLAEPGTAQSLQFTLSRFASPLVSLQVAPCTRPGLTRDGLTCVPCRYGWYSLDNSGECHPCPEGGLCRGGASMTAAPGYWRSGNDSATFHKCPTGLCTGDEECHKGHRGVVCAICEKHYFKLGTSSCIQCPSRSVVGSLVIAAIVMGVVVVLMGVLFMFRAYLPSRSRFKIATSLFQLLNVALLSFEVEWPPVFLFMLRFFSIFNLDFLALTGIGCTQEDDFSYSTRLAVAAVTPILIVVAVLLARVFWRRRQARTGAVVHATHPTDSDSSALASNSSTGLEETDEQQEQASDHSGAWSSVVPTSGVSSEDGETSEIASVSKSHHVTRSSNARTLRLALIGLYFVYPSVSSKLLGVFDCREVDGVFYLREDYREICFEGSWYTYAMGASVMTLVYTVGLPVFLLAAMLRASRSRTAATSVFSFFTNDYVGSLWAWELFEMMRKLILARLVVFVSVDVLTQLFTAMGVSVVALTMTSILRPYASPSDGRTQEVALVALLSALFFGAMLKSNAGGGGPFEVIMSFFVMLCMVVVVGLVVYHTWKEIRQRHKGSSSSATAAVSSFSDGEYTFVDGASSVICVHTSATDDDATSVLSSSGDPIFH